jgi:hypothetical protein
MQFDMLAASKRLQVSQLLITFVFIPVMNVDIARKGTVSGLISLAMKEFPLPVLMVVLVSIPALSAPDDNIGSDRFFCHANRVAPLANSDNGTKPFSSVKIGWLPVPINFAPRAVLSS